MPYLLVTVIISIFVALFAVQNAINVDLHFFLWNFSTSLIMVILGSFFIGILVGCFYLLMVKARHYMKNKKIREEIEGLQAEKKALEEKVTMLMHTQIQRSDVPKKAEVAEENK
ncbi:MAG: LapA family protein [Phascolarctobacterium sp.]|nr:LapA family protein [Phascolarctobacterium sp.]